MAFSFPRPYSHKFTKGERRRGMVYNPACVPVACVRARRVTSPRIRCVACDVVACAVPWLGTARCDGGFLLPCCSRIAAGLSI